MRLRRRWSFGRLLPTRVDDPVEAFQKASKQETVLLLALNLQLILVASFFHFLADGRLALDPTEMVPPENGEVKWTWESIGFRLPENPTAQCRANVSRRQQQSKGCRLTPHMYPSRYLGMD